MVPLDSLCARLWSEVNVLFLFQIVRQRIWDFKQVKTKSCEIDLVTEIDQQVEEMLISSLTSHFPNHK